jgi:hypothetical protein
MQLKHSTAAEIGKISMGEKRVADIMIEAENPAPASFRNLPPKACICGSYKHQCATKKL